MRVTPIFFSALMSAVVAVVVGACAEKKPDRLALDPAGPFTFERKGESETVKVMAWEGKRPFVKAVPVVYTSSDGSVVTVDPLGVITCTGSGEATITAEAWALTTTATARCSVIGSVEVKDDVPKPFRSKQKEHRLSVVVKDDKGKPIDKPKVGFRATDYCVEVDDDGLLKWLTEGECDVVVSVADKSARVKIVTKE
jgi:hypothetical protein